MSCYGRSESQLGDEGRSLDVLAGGGESGAAMRAMDWSQTPVGPVQAWPQSLQTTVKICLNSRFPVVIGWGPEFTMFYNDAGRPLLGGTQSGSPGRSG